MASTSTFRGVLTVVGNAEDGVAPSVVLEMGRGGNGGAESRWRAPLESVQDVLVFGAVGEGFRRCCNEHHIKITAVSHVFLGRSGPLELAGLASVGFQLRDAGMGKLVVVGPRGLADEVDHTKLFFRASHPELVVRMDEDGEPVSLSSADETFAAKSPGAGWASRSMPVTGDSMAHHVIVAFPGGDREAPMLRGELLLLPDGGLELERVHTIAGRWERSPLTTLTEKGTLGPLLGGRIVVHLTDGEAYRADVARVFGGLRQVSGAVEEFAWRLPTGRHGWDQQLLASVDASLGVCCIHVFFSARPLWEGLARAGSEAVRFPLHTSAIEVVRLSSVARSLFRPPFGRSVPPTMPAGAAYPLASIGLVGIGSLVELDGRTLRGEPTGASIGTPGSALVLTGSSVHAIHHSATKMLRPPKRPRSPAEDSNEIDLGNSDAPCSAAAEPDTSTTAPTGTCARVDEDSKEHGPKEHGPRLHFLGTGAAAPSKRRGCSGLYLALSSPSYEDGDMSPRSGVLLDCGEGSMGALCRRFGRGVIGCLLGLEAVWISHHHADHHTGLATLIVARETARTLAGGKAPPLVVIAWGQMLRIVERLHTSLLRHWPDLKLDVRAAKAVISLPSVELRSFAVPHCRDSLGVRAEVAGSDRSVVYSGDTVPCAMIEEMAEGCSVLVHEATFDDSMADHASRKNHSTVSGALRVARAAKADLTVLTHFSQRYSHMTRLVSILQSMQTQTGVPVLAAFDGMQLPLTQTPLVFEEMVRAYNVMSVPVEGQDDD
jgi:ribonuclease BN (tRNA processing enzyme)